MACYAPVTGGELDVVATTVGGAGVMTVASSPASSAVGGAATSAAATVPTSIPTSAPASVAHGTCATGSVTCENDGALVCIGRSQFGICDRGCAVPQGLADGTICENGLITRRAVNIRRVVEARRRRMMRW